MSLVHYLNCRDITSPLYHSKPQNFVPECRGLEEDDNHGVSQFATISNNSPTHYWPVKNRIIKPLKTLTSISTFMPTVISKNFQTRTTKTSKLNVMARMALELAFKFSNYPSHVDKQRLAQSCNMTHKQIDIWFQNRRDRGAKQQPGALSQVDSIEKLREALQSMLLLARPKPKSVAHDSIDMWRSQILLEAPSKSVPTPSISAMSIDSDLEEPSRLNFEDRNTQISESDMFSNKSDSDPPSISTHSQFNNVFSFPQPQWIRQRSLKSNKKSTIRTRCDINSLLPNFQVLHVKGTTSLKAAELPKTDVASDSMVNVHGSNTKSPMNLKNTSPSRRIAPMPRRRAPCIKGDFNAQKGLASTEGREISICSNSVSAPFLSS